MKQRKSSWRAKTPAAFLLLALFPAVLSCNADRAPDLSELGLDAKKYKAAESHSLPSVPGGGYFAYEIHMASADFKSYCDSLDRERTRIMSAEEFRSLESMAYAPDGRLSDADKRGFYDIDHALGRRFAFADLKRGSTGAGSREFHSAILFTLSKPVYNNDRAVIIEFLPGDGSSDLLIVF